jgi:hypothetical protein
MAQNRERGIFDKQRKYRDGQTQRRRRDVLSGNAQDRLSRAIGVNAVGRRLGVGARGRFGFGETGRGALDLQSQINADEYLKSNPLLQKLQFDDDANNVMGLSGGTEAGARQAARDLFTDENGNYDSARAERAVARARAVGFSRSNAQAALTTMAQNKSRAVAVGARGREQVQAGINRLAGGNEVMAGSLRDSFAYNSNSAGRGDLASTNWNATSDSGISTASLEGFRRSSLYQASNGHQNGVIGATNDSLNLLATGRHEDALRAAIHYAELESLKSSGSGPIADAANEQMRRMEIAGIGAVLQSQMLSQNGGPVQENRRVDYDSSNPAHTSWSSEEKARGWRTEARNLTLGDMARREARPYDPPNPNRE